MEKQSDLKELKRRLKKSSEYQQLSILLSSIISNQTKQDPVFMKKSLPVLKQLLSEIVDSSFNFTRQIIQSSLPKPFKHTRHVTSVPKLDYRKHENQLTYSSDALTNGTQKKTHKNALSEFSYIKGPVFNKSIREIDKIRVPSPGPSFYYYDTLNNKNRSPRVIFPKSAADRNSYIPASPSPGPTRYYSSIRYLAKN